jgi:hypothetical protein
MAYKIITASGTANTATLILSTVDGLEVGLCVRVYNTGNNKIDGRRKLVTVDDETDTVTFDSPSIGTLAPFNPPNATLVPLTTWVNDADVGLFLGIDPATDDDAEFLATVVEAGNDFAYRRRQNAGYSDSRCIIPSPSVKEGTVLYCASLYRERGSVDSFQSFDAMSMPQPSLTMGRIMQLLGINRPQVG